MTIEEFVRAVKIQTSDSAVRGTLGSLDSPPGRKPRKHLVQLSEWYRQLESKDQAMLADALKEAAEMAVFEFFCVLDGASAIEDPPEKGGLELYFVKAGEKIRLNDPQKEELHNLFNALCQEPLPSPRLDPETGGNPGDRRNVF